MNRASGHPWVGRRVWVRLVRGQPPAEGTIQSVDDPKVAGGYNVLVRVTHCYGAFSVPVREAARGQVWGLLEDGGPST
jgi:hypothetical protein